MATYCAIFLTLVVKEETIAVIHIDINNEKNIPKMNRVFIGNDTPIKYETYSKIEGKLIKISIVKPKSIHINVYFNSYFFRLIKLNNITRYTRTKINKTIRAVAVIFPPFLIDKLKSQ